MMWLIEGRRKSITGTCNDDAIFYTNSTQLSSSSSVYCASYNQPDPSSVYWYRYGGHGHWIKLQYNVDKGEPRGESSTKIVVCLFVLWRVVEVALQIETQQQNHNNNSKVTRWKWYFGTHDKLIKSLHHPITYEFHKR